MNANGAKPEDDRAASPEWRAARRLRRPLWLIALVLVIELLHAASDFIVPLVIAVLIAATFRPAIQWLALRGVAAWITAGAFALVLLVGGLGGAYLVTGPIATWVSETPHIQQTFAIKMKALLAPISRVAEITENLKDAAKPQDGQDTPKVEVAEPAIPALLWFAAYPAGYIAMLAGALVVSLFLMASGNLPYETIVRVMPTLTDKKNALRLIHDVEREVSSYLLLLTAINAGVGIAIGIGFFFMGMPNAFLWAFVAFVLNFIPYAGPLAGAAFAGISAIVVFDSIAYAMLAPAIYTLAVTVENQLVSPYLLGRRLELNTVAILVAFGFFAWLWGLIGVAVAVPLLVMFRVFTLHVPALANVGEFLSVGSLSTPERDGAPEPEPGRRLSRRPRA